MDVSQLMIGDWVYSSFTEHPCKITHIGLFGDRYIEVGVTGVLGLKDIASLTPIPLTQEILEKNFKEVTDDLYSSDYTLFQFIDSKKYKGFYIEYYNKYNYACITDHTMLKLEYVHQLQHALNLCGIEKEINV